MKNISSFWRSPVFQVSLLAGISLAVYLLASRLTFRLGFPLDDAWIHQTYARNLALHGEWAFLPGQPSAGSTAPLWSALLAVGHFLRLGPYLWTFFLGWACLAGLAWQARSLFLALSAPAVKEPAAPASPARLAWGFWLAVFLVLEYHLVWASASGMETLLFAFLLLAGLAGLAQPQPRWVRLGLICGGCVWVRPDGITLLGPALVVLALCGQDLRKRWRGLQGLAVGAGALVLLYALFNLNLSGAWLPNTFFAKQAEYAIYRELPLWKRIMEQASLPLVGAGALLLPGLVIFLVQALRQKRWAALAVAAWLGGYLLLYALRLPVTYQHGRYVIPAMPVYFTCGMVGMAGWVQWNAPLLWKRSLGKAWVFALALVLAVFWGLGAQAYGRDVAVIESEMVETARWVAQNTGPGDLVAAHDIGALGYFSQRNLLDLAGLVSPEVIPFLRDEARLKTFLDERRAAYLVTFPGWYPRLVQTGSLVFQTQGAFSPALGGENMAVYRWNIP